MKCSDFSNKTAFEAIELAEKNNLEIKEVNSMTTHRAIQLSVLVDNLESLYRTFHRCSLNLRKIGNSKGASYYTAKAMRVERVLFNAKARVGL